MSEITLDVNLNELWTMSYDFDNLKAALGQILKELNFNKKSLHFMTKTIEDQNKEIQEYLNLF
jgi:hypothetical protein